MSNYHLRDKRLTLKAKGLLSQMLSLPEEWDYTLTGLAEINKESKDAIRTAVQELEQAGYILRRQTYGSDGKFSSNEYVIRELPAQETPLLENPTTVTGETSPLLDFPTTENSSTEKPTTENPTQLSKDILSTNKERKINKKKESPPKEDFDPMDQIKNWIADQFYPAPAYIKNRLYFAFKGFVDNRAALKKPFKTKGAVTGLCNRLGRLTCKCENQLEIMIELLEDATSNNWQSVYIRGSQPQPQADVPEGRHYDVI